ncbi:TRAP transporter small permease [Billgrantia desiderata]|uniref:TRAP transporter small permease protein n=1 Tax=Billgrantia desiderata TaxID=52021 RepID=A0AAW4YXC4_9GAMM|nr:TRAP transporter small permease [Halomonas desiderata]MCE8044464.1 TRAP transporter small permease [Halomonas desiderata]MCE8049102.1 TRAP transporter small permease [Halomonas desiderata]MCE8052666.1 TRAP transporter small permease [Halomonas desiderata]
MRIYVDVEAAVTLPRLKRITGKILDGLANLCLAVAGVMLVFLIAIFGWLVFGRYVLNNTPTWVEQAALLLVVYITCLGAAAGVRGNSHLSIDFVREGMPEPLRTILRYVADLFVVAFGAFMAYQGWGLVMTNLERAIPMIRLAESWRAAPLVICGVLLVLFSVANIVSRIIDNASNEGN